MTEEIIIRYLNNQCTDQELTEVRRWIEESDQNAKLLFELEQLVDAAFLLQENSEERQKVFRAIQERINSEESDSDLMSSDTGTNKNEWTIEDKETIFSARTRTGNRNRLSKSWLAVACVMILVLTSLGVFCLLSGTKMIEAKALDQTLTIDLPDGSQVFLKDGSSLRYPEKFASSSREVRLWGEGFFKVTQDAQRPFIVEGQQLKVTVMGTEFSFVSNKEGNNYVTLLKGSVKVTAQGEPEEVILSPGQKASYNDTAKKLVVTQANIMEGCAVSTGLIPFENATIEDIAKKIGELYEVEIITQGVDSTKTYSGSTNSYPDVGSTLSQLANTLPIVISHKGDSIIISSIANQ